MNKITNAIKCGNCKSVLQSPVLLPCEHSICKLHITSKPIKCERCGEEHEPPSTGFPTNRALAEIIDAQINELSFGRTHEEAKHSCSDLESLLTDFNDLLNDPVHFVVHEIGLLKNMVQIKTEELKLKIESESEILIKTLDEYQVRCKVNFSNSDYSNESKRIHEMKLVTLLKLGVWEKELDLLRFDEEKWARIRNESQILIKEMKENFESFKKNLLLNNYEETKSHVQYFHNIDINPLFNFLKFKSTIIEPSLRKQFFDVCEFDINHNWTLLYRASVHGFGATDFHARCDYKSGTLTIVKTTDGFVFGGYTEALWNHLGKESNFRPDPNAFIFSLVNNYKHSIKINVSAERQHRAIYSNESTGPSFGYGDFFISNNSSSNRQSSSNLGSSYFHHDFQSNSTDNYTFLAGAKNFQVLEIEVFHRK